MNEYLIPSIIILVLVLLNGVFVAAEFGIVAARRTQILQLVQQGSIKAKQVLETLSNFQNQNLYITTAQVGITIVSLGLGMYGEHVVADWLLAPLENLSNFAEPVAHTIAIVLSVAILTYLHVVIGEMIPKSLALQEPVSTSLRLQRLMMIFGRMFSPLVWSLNAVGNFFTSLIGINQSSSSNRQMFSSEELEWIVEESSEGGKLDDFEHLFIDNIFDLSERTAGQIMTPRNHVQGIPIEADLSTTLNIICDSNKTRYPVFEDDLDKILGIFHIKDLARYVVNQDKEVFDLRALCRPATFLPESQNLQSVLKEFRAKHHQIAVVVDEFGGTAGLLSIEDLAEEVVGEIRDEFDSETELIKKISDRSISVRGDVLLDEINQLYDLALRHEDADTVGGLVMAVLGRMPRNDDRLEFDGIKIEVESLDGLVVKRVLLTLPENPMDDPEP